MRGREDTLTMAKTLSLLAIAWLIVLELATTAYADEFYNRPCRLRHE